MIRIFAFLIVAGLGYPLCGQGVAVHVGSDAIAFTEGNDSILSYQLAENSLDGAYSRSNYIHPLYALDGEVLTEDFPPDHLHHRGIFWAWHQLYIGGKRIGDGWEIKDFLWEVVSAQEIEATGYARAIQTAVLWKSPRWTDDEGKELPVVRETTTLTVYPAGRSYRQIDIEIAILALENNMRIGGSEDAKGYGGFSARVRLAGDMEFAGPSGKIRPDNLPVEGGGWLDISGPIGRGGAMEGISILSHPENPGYPNPWILRASESMQNAVYPYPGATAVPLSTTRPTVLRYRLLIHEGNSEALDIRGIHAAYGKAGN